MKFRLALVAKVVDEDGITDENADIIEENLSRVEEIIRGITEAPFTILDMVYTEDSVFDLVVQVKPLDQQYDWERDTIAALASSEEIGQYIMNFYNDDVKGDTWLEGDMSINNDFTLDLECTDWVLDEDK